VRGQLRSVWKPLALWFYLPAAIFLAMVVVWVVGSPDVAPEELFRDVATVAEVPWYSGLVSQVGAVLWAAGATVCLLAYVVLRSLGAARPRALRYLLHAGLVTGFLLADDLFLLHEEVVAIHLSVEQRTVYAAYLLLLLAFVVGNRRELLSSRWIVLFAAFGLLGASMGMDLVTDTFHDSLLVEGSFYERYEVVFEDGVKLFGILTWFAFHVLYVLDRFAAAPRGWLLTSTDDVPELLDVSSAPR
jgi:hypothetical protein